MTDREILMEKTYLGMLMMLPGSADYREVTVEYVLLDEDGNAAFSLCADGIVGDWQIGTIDEAIKAYEEKREK